MTADDVDAATARHETGSSSNGSTADVPSVSGGTLIQIPSPEGDAPDDEKRKYLSEKLF